ncbi:ORF6N domain-containing protein [Hafnia alvei]|uniref:ORF6N domain-containing protein n=1 Tax=Hafnia alvei TaxID=569 RepID=UPI00141348CC|nr:ORF6N domain-containing protein [Hafnia alvei]QIP56862.1 ORF6N domain-containing protein [Hafnia alvei]
MSMIDTLKPILHNQIPVITTELLAQLYGAKVKNISDNYLNNITRFVAGKHYFKIEKSELREFKNRPETIGLVGKNARSLILWTERGAARHAKMLETDQAWEVFEKLEDCYFNQKINTPPQIPKHNKVLLRFNGEQLISSQHLPDNYFVGPMETFIEVLRRQGLVVINPEDLKKISYC